MYGHFRYKVEVLGWVEAETRKPEVTGMNVPLYICKYVTVVFSLMHILLKDFIKTVFKKGNTESKLLSCIICPML